MSRRKDNNDFADLANAIMHPTGGISKRNRAQFDIIRTENKQGGQTVGEPCGELTIEKSARGYTATMHYTFYPQEQAKSEDVANALVSSLPWLRFRSK